VGVERALYKGGLLLGDGPMHDSLVLLHFWTQENENEAIG